jgi:hypothetical protein
MRFRINTPRIAFEQIEDETIIIDFDSGTYFSAGPVGSDIVRQLARGISPDEAVEYARRWYTGDPQTIERGIREFVDALQRESILVEMPPDEAAPPESPSATPSGQTVFEAPILNKYTDMKDLLLLDPIHEVDAEGWPIQKPDA